MTLPPRHAASETPIESIVLSGIIVLAVLTSEISVPRAARHAKNVAWHSWTRTRRSQVEHAERTREFMTSNVYCKLMRKEWNRVLEFSSRVKARKRFACGLFGTRRSVRSTNVPSSNDALICVKEGPL